MSRKLSLLSLLIVLVIALMSTVSAAASDESPLKVAASTSLIADVARAVGGDLVEVTAIIPPGADSHSYTPSPRDVVAIADADVVLVNGLELEESLLPVIEENASVEPVIVSLGVRIVSTDRDHGHDHDDEHMDDAYIGVLGVDAVCDIEPHHHDDDHEHDNEHADDHDHDDEHDDDHSDEHADEHSDDHDHGPCDPHVWYDPANVMIWTSNIAAAFAAADPANAETYEANAQAYIAELEALIEEIAEQIASVPEANRVLVTNHDFLAYFAVPYGFDVVGTVIPAATTLAEVSPGDIIALVEVIREYDAPAIFAEYSVSTSVAETVAREVGRDVAVVRLFSESLSEADGPAATYIDYMRYNVSAIVTALGGNAG